MEVNNRFNILASFSVDDEVIDTVSNDIIVSKLEEHDDQEPTKNFWEIPEYIEKTIPCVIPLPPKEDISKKIVKKKSSQRSKRDELKIDEVRCEEEQNEIDIQSIVEVNPQPTTIFQSDPPKPYKFKPSNTNHRNEIKPKFDRKSYSLPKHTPVRGNSKSCTHQI